MNLCVQITTAAPPENRAAESSSTRPNYLYAFLAGLDQQPPRRDQNIQRVARKPHAALAPLSGSLPARSASLWPGVRGRQKRHGQPPTDSQDVDDVQEAVDELQAWFEPLASHDCQQRPVGGFREVGESR